MKYDRDAGIVETLHKGERKRYRLSDITPAIMWDWIKSGRAHKGMFVDWLEARRRV